MSVLRVFVRRQFSMQIWCKIACNSHFSFLIIRVSYDFLSLNSIISFLRNRETVVHSCACSLDFSYPKWITCVWRTRITISHPNMIYNLQKHSKHFFLSPIANRYQFHARPRHRGNHRTLRNRRFNRKCKQNREMAALSGCHSGAENFLSVH